MSGQGQGAERNRGELQVASLLLAGGSAIQDRLAVYHEPGRWTLVVADGAGGVGGGADAARGVLREVDRILRSPGGKGGPDLDWGRVFRDLDERLLADPSVGETTAVVVQIEESGVSGVSVGDSEAWLVREGELTVLTARQCRRRLGTGVAWPELFRSGPLEGSVLVGSDGLFGYLEREEILSHLQAEDPDGCLEALEETLRARFRELPDDLAMILARSSSP